MKSLQVRIYLFLGMIFIANCLNAQTNDYNNYFTVLDEGEGNYTLIQIQMKDNPPTIKDTIYVLMDIFDNFDNADLSNENVVSGLFKKLPPHPISLIKKTVNKGIISFTSDWLNIEGNKQRFSFKGKHFGRKIIGAMKDDWQPKSSSEIFTDKQKVEFFEQ